MNTTLINGCISTDVAITDRGLHYGDGVFETLAVKNQLPCDWAQHYARLQQGCERLALPCPDASLLLAELKQLAQAEPHIIKIIITRGVGGRGYTPPTHSDSSRIVQCHPWPAYPPAFAKTGIDAIFCQTTVSSNRHLAAIKHLNRLDNVLASAEVAKAQAQEGLMCDDAAQLIQGTKSNVFYEKAGALYTPALSTAGVAGIMRAKIITWAKQLQIPVHIQPIPLSALEVAEGVFVCNSVFGIWPICRLAGQAVPMGPVTQQLLIFYNKTQQEELS